MKYRHLNSGGIYEVLHENAIFESTMCPMVVYKGEDGQIWIRPQVQFFDGRFEAIREGIGPQIGVHQMLERNAELLGVTVDEMKSMRLRSQIGAIVPIKSTTEHVKPTHPKTDLPLVVAVSSELSALNAKLMGTK